MSYPKSNPLLKPTVLTDRVKAEIIQLLAEGNFLTTACLAAGISADTYYHWKKRYDEGDSSASVHADFFDTVSKAVAIAESNALRNLKNGEQGWQAEAWFLERRHPKRWGKKVRVELPPGKKPEDMTDAELEAIARGKGTGRA